MGEERSFLLINLQIQTYHLDPSTHKSEKN